MPGITDYPTASDSVGASILGDQGGVTKNFPVNLLAGSVADGAVGTTKLADLAVTAAKLAADAVTAAKIADGAVSTAKLADLAVTAGKLAALAVTEGKLAALAVTEGKLADLAVTAAKLAADAVTESKILTAAVTETKLADLAVTEGKLADLAVTSGKLADLAVSAAKLASAAVTTAKIDTLAVTNAKLAADAVTASKIADGAVTSAKLGSGAAAGNLDANSVALTKLANRAASTLLGRRSGSTGATEEVTLGTGLSMSAAGVLSSSGGGSSLLRARYVLTGADSVEVPATAPTPLTLEFNMGGASHSGGTVTVTVDGSAVVFYIQDTDPSNTPWIDTSGMSSTSDVLTALSATITAAFGGITVSESGLIMTITRNATGASASLAIATAQADVYSSGGGGSGTDLVAAVGGVQEFTIIAQDGTKTIYPVRCFIAGAGVAAPVQFALKVASTYYPLGANFAANATYGDLVDLSAYYQEWITGRASASLVARIIGTLPLGGSIYCAAIVEQY
jgi:hypothetical protein